MAIKQYKKYEDVPVKYRYDLDHLLEGKTIEFRMDEVINEYKKLIPLKDSKYDSPEKYLEAHKISLKVSRMMNKVRNYLSNSLSVNVVDPKITELSGKLQFELYKISTELGSESNRFFKHAKKMEEWATRPDFKNLKKNILATLEDKKYKLPDLVEEYLIKLSNGEVNAQDPFSILTNSELDYGHATSSKGKKIKITPANRIELLKDEDDKVRKTTSISWTDASFRHKETLANLLSQHIKSITTDSKVRGYKSAIDSLVHDDRSDVKLLETLYKEVIDHKMIFKKYRDSWKKYYKIKYGKAATKYDMMRELVDIKSTYTIEEAQKMVLESFKPFGTEYHGKVKEAFANRWIDYMPVDNKRSGAYSIGGAYGLDKIYIMMNFTGELGSVKTLAHELGHSMHSYYSCKTQPQELAAYKIFVAEIASIFNELMLCDYLLKTSKDDKVKFRVLEQMIDGFTGTVMRQTEWSNYEFELYNAIEAGKPINNYSAISKIYYENSQKYAIKPKKKYVDKENIASVTVPHFYYGFYVYKYAIGQLAANIFFAKYKKEGSKALETYISKFLSAGGKDFPLNILKESGIDLYDKSSYELGFSYVKDLVDQYVELGNKIFKTKKQTNKKGKK